MYIRKSIRSYKGTTYTNYVLVESVHTAKGPRQRTICSLGDLSPRPAADWLRLARKVEDALLGQAHPFAQPDPAAEPIVRQVRQPQARAAHQRSPHPTHAPAPRALIAAHTDRLAMSK